MAELHPLIRNRRRGREIDSGHLVPARTIEASLGTARQEKEFHSTERKSIEEIVSREDWFQPSDEKS